MNIGFNKTAFKINGDEIKITGSRSATVILNVQSPVVIHPPHDTVLKRRLDAITEYLVYQGFFTDPELGIEIKFMIHIQHPKNPCPDPKNLLPNPKEY